PAAAPGACFLRELAPSRCNTLENDGEFSCSHDTSSGRTQKIGAVPHGTRVTAPISSGCFEGRRLRGRVAPGGGDLDASANRRFAAWRIVFPPGPRRGSEHQTAKWAFHGDLL